MIHQVHTDDSYHQSDLHKHLKYIWKLPQSDISPEVRGIQYGKIKNLHKIDRLAASDKEYFISLFNKN